ncbi:S1 family peptidase [Rhodococcus sp. WMMA185]|uniref:S1 family peptidase n=1 Tax=Rhodococcus sp. WMMA185 TaxID=679318 RepID=UPI0012F4EFFB|nr:S1 family peptidase [Rhodococcus sp. WMMA185]
MSTARKIAATATATLTFAGLGFGVASAAPADEKAASATTSVGPGTTITVKHPDGSRWRCTVAFAATTPSNQPVALTAGHCAIPGSKVYVDGRLIGETDQTSSRDGGRFSADWATIALNDRAEPVAASDKVSPESVGKARVGDEVCLQGSTSGWQCGEVTGILGDWIYSDLEHAPGDSGGPLIRTSDNAAVGIHSGWRFDEDYAESYSLPAALTKAGGYLLTTVDGPAPLPEESSLFGS